MNRLFAIAKRRLKPLLAFNLLLLAGLTYSLHTRPMSWNARVTLMNPAVSAPLKGRSASVAPRPLASLQARLSGASLPLTLHDGLSSVWLSNEMLMALWQQDRERDRFASLAAYSALFTLSPQNGGASLLLNVEASESAIAQDRLDRWMALLGDRLAQLPSAESARPVTFTQADVALAEAQLEQAQAELTAFQTASGLISGETQARGLVEILGQLKNRQTEITAAQLSNQVQLDTFREQLDLTPEGVMQSLALGEDEAYQLLRQDITRLDAQIVERGSLYQADHPELRSLQFERDQLQQQAASLRTQLTGSPELSTEAGASSFELSKQLLGAKTNAKAKQQVAQALSQQIAHLEQQLQSLPQQQAQLAKLQRQYDIAEGAYRDALAQGTSSSFNSAEAYPEVQLLVPPQLVAEPIGPKLGLMVLGVLFMAGGGSTALALLPERRRSQSGLADEPKLNLPVLGTVPWLSAPGSRQRRSDARKFAFQRLAAGITAMNLQRRRLLVSSAVSREGKTTATIGLGLALAALGFRVLLVDGDFAQAGLTQRLQRKIATVNTTTEMLGAPVSMAPNLDLMPTAPGRSRQAMNFIASGKFEAQLDWAERVGRYDYLLVDTAPVELTNETSMMGTVAPNVLLVTRSGVSQRDQVYQALAEFSQHRVHLLGLLIHETTPHRPSPRQPVASRQPARRGIG